MATNNNEFFDALAALEKERGLPADYLIDKIKAALCERRPASLAEWNELRNMLLTAEGVTRAALERKESLGAHCRAD